VKDLPNETEHTGRKAKLKSKKATDFKEAKNLLESNCNNGGNLFRVNIDLGSNRNECCAFVTLEYGEKRKENIRNRVTATSILACVEQCHSYCNMYITIL